MTEKKRAWNLLLTVLAALAVCTVMSGCVERQMTAQAVTVRGQGGSKKVPLDALVYDEEGTHLYEIAEGEGWETGLRIREIPGSDYQVEKSGVSDIYGMYHRYVHYASKPVMDGDLVCVVDQQTEEDQYLIVWSVESDEIREWLKEIRSEGFDIGEPESAGIKEELEKAGLESAGTKEATEKVKLSVLLPVEGKQPFMELQAKSELAAPKGVRIYSLNDIGNLKKMIPLLVMCLIILIVLAVILAHGFRKTQGGKSDTIILVRQGILIAVLLIFLTGILSKISLPSSLLPKENIFQITYYIDELKEIKNALEAVR